MNIWKNVYFFKLITEVYTLFNSWIQAIFNEIQNNILVKQNQSFLFNNNKGKNIYYVEYLFLGLKRKYLCVK